MSNKYRRIIKRIATFNHIGKPVFVTVEVDVYDVLKAFNVTCPAMAHGIKKCLAPGQRGVKDSIQDKQEAIVSITRSISMETDQMCEDDNGIDVET